MSHGADGPREVSGDRSSPPGCRSSRRHPPYGDNYAPLTALRVNPGSPAGAPLYCSHNRRAETAGSAGGTRGWKAPDVV
ncbi:hypothetical protein GCM10027187_47130 [Streptosporangium sandarakinum]